LLDPFSLTTNSLIYAADIYTNNFLKIRDKQTNQTN